MQPDPKPADLTLRANVATRTTSHHFDEHLPLRPALGIPVSAALLYPHDQGCGFTGGRLKATSVLPTCSRFKEKGTYNHSGSLTFLHQVHSVLRSCQRLAERRNIMDIRVGSSPSASYPDTAPFVGTTWTNKTADATKGLTASELSLPASADRASFPRTLLVKEKTRASPPLVHAVRDDPSTMVQQCAAVVRRKVSTICEVGISGQDRSDLSRLLLELSLPMGAPPGRE